MGKGKLGLVRLRVSSTLLLLNRDRQRPPEGHTPSFEPRSASITRDDRTASRLRTWGFRAAGIVLVPVVLFVVLELGLRMAGYGYRTSFFVPTRIQGRQVLVENPDFGRRFFPAELVRTPSPVVMTERKPAGTYRIFLFGESAAMGDPRPAYGAGRWLAELLRARFPGTEFEVVCTAMTAINSHAILPIARECTRYDGDLWIVDMGNNEMVGPFGANTVFGSQAPPLWLVRARLALESTRTGQWLTALAQRFHSGAPRKTWSGLKMFRNNQLPPADPRRERIYSNFRHNLLDLVRAGRRAGVPVLLTSVPTNLRNCGPFGSFTPESLNARSLGEFTNDLAAARSFLAHEHLAEAKRLLEKAVTLAPQNAEVHFQLGQCLLAMTNLLDARQSFVLARDLDTLPFRADSRLNAITKDVAQDGSAKETSFVDAVAGFAAPSPGGVPGREWFLEHVHLTPEGNYQLARLWADQVAQYLPTRMAAARTVAWLSFDACAERLGLTDWNRATILEEILQRELDPPYTDQCDHSAIVERLRTTLAQLHEGIRSRPLDEVRARYEEAIRRRPSDFWLHHNYAEFLVAIGDLSEASHQMEQVRDLIPYHYSAYYQLGRILARQHQFEAAEKNLRVALQLQPRLAEAHLELGQIFARQKRFDDALAEYTRAQQASPETLRVYLLRAQVLEEQNKRDQAIQDLQEAVRLRSSSWEAQHLLAVELALTGNLAEAEKAFARAAAERPSDPGSHMDLAMAQARLGRFHEAHAQLQRVLQLDPGNQQAQSFIRALEQKSQQH